jgi:hypothetical protein
MLLAAFLAVADPVSFEEAKALADANEANLSSDMRGQLLQSQGEALGSALGACAQPGMDLKVFTLVFRLNADGTVARSWREGETPLARCMHKELVASGFEGLWPEPFYTSIKLTLKAEQQKI